MPLTDRQSQLVNKAQGLIEQLKEYSDKAQSAIWQAEVDLNKNHYWYNNSDNKKNLDIIEKKISDSIASLQKCIDDLSKEGADAQTINDLIEQFKGIKGVNNYSIIIGAEDDIVIEKERRIEQVTQTRWVVDPDDYVNGGHEEREVLVHAEVIPAVVEERPYINRVFKFALEGRIIGVSPAVTALNEKGKNFKQMENTAGVSQDLLKSIKNEKEKETVNYYNLGVLLEQAENEHNVHIQKEENKRIRNESLKSRVEKLLGNPTILTEDTKRMFENFEKNKDDIFKDEEKINILENNLVAADKQVATYMRDKKLFDEGKPDFSHKFFKFCSDQSMNALQEKYEKAKSGTPADLSNYHEAFENAKKQSSQQESDVGRNYWSLQDVLWLRYEPSLNKIMQPPFMPLTSGESYKGASEEFTKTLKAEITKRQEVILRNMRIYSYAESFDGLSEGLRNAVVNLYNVKNKSFASFSNPLRGLRKADASDQKMEYLRAAKEFLEDPTSDEKRNACINFKFNPRLEEGSTVLLFKKNIELWDRLQREGLCGEPKKLQPKPFADESKASASSSSKFSMKK